VKKLSNSTKVLIMMMSLKRSIEITKEKIQPKILLSLSGRSALLLSFSFKSDLNSSKTVFVLRVQEEKVLLHFESFLDFSAHLSRQTI
jgi:hypothetical protein